MTAEVMRASSVRPFAREVATLIHLALPLILGQLFGIGTDVILSIFGGHMGATVMASVALGSSLWIVVFMAVVGMMMSRPAGDLRSCTAPGGATRPAMCLPRRCFSALALASWAGLRLGFDRPGFRRLRP